jgi:Fe-S oxidoreductase
MEYEEILHRCFRCGWCKLPTDFTDFNCPSYLKYRFETYSPGGRLWLIRAWLNGEMDLSDRFQEIIFSCATCKNCVEACGLPKIKDYLVDMMIAARGEIVDRGVVPPSIREYFMGIYNRGNPLKKPQSERGDWAKGLDIPSYDGHEYLFYVGDVGSFDETAIKMTRAVASLLKETISMGILGEDENSDGNDVKALGEKGLFEHLAVNNINQFNERGVKKIITLSPHAFNAMRNDYPLLRGNFEVYHYTQVLSRIFADTRSIGTLNARITYHDPCYLGRWNGEYFAPRGILQSISGISYIEMDRNMGNALCCGGGGGNYFTDILGSGEDSAGRSRIRDARDSDTEIVAVSCPICYKMLDDAVKDEGLENSMRIMDVAQVVLESQRG